MKYDAQFEGRVNFDMPPKQEAFHCKAIMSALPAGKEKKIKNGNSENTNNVSMHDHNIDR